MILEFGKFVPLMGSDNITVMLTASQDDIVELATMQQQRKTRKVELRFKPDDTRVIPAAETALADIAHRLESMAQDARNAIEGIKTEQEGTNV